MRENGRVSEPEIPAVQSSDADLHEVDVQEATVRRAPKLGVFLVVGAALGALITLMLTSLYPADPNVGFGATYAYFLVYGIPLGLLLGALVGLVLDRRSRRRIRTVEVEHQRVD